MTGGETALLIGGVVVVGGGAAWWYFSRTAADATPIYGSPPYPYTTSVKPTPPGAPPAAPSAAAQLQAGFDAINAAGCQAAAAKVSAGLSSVADLGSIGCSAFLKYATPIGAAELLNQKVLTKIPGVAPAENAVASVADKTYSGAKSVVNKVLSFL